MRQLVCNEEIKSDDLHTKIEIIRKKKFGETSNCQNGIFSNLKVTQRSL